MRKLNVWRIGDEDAQLVGEIFDQPIAFRYSASYLESSEAHAISLSLPLRDDSFSEEELVPYFNGLQSTAVSGRVTATRNARSS